MAAVFVDLDSANQSASIVGAVVGLAGLVASLYGLHRTGDAQGGGTSVTASGARAVAIGGNAGTVVTGDGVTVPAAAPAPPAPGVPGGQGGAGAVNVQAQGDRSIAAGADIGTAVTGDGERR
ncbi:hypothetical protein E4099_17920 [Streptomyces palmae]|uniref:Uncharacterized protein n=2 Tax=Streptomyces palmae TaxID=1701085 RepID=A0A4Z0HB17_9ACTN|nr:hypothetical protein E4099_17920 [Streptomyces palmae]